MADEYRTRQVRRWDGGWRSAEDRLVVEEPLEIRIGGAPFSVTMRTPGMDYELARGLLFTEGVIASLDQIGAMRYEKDCDVDGHPRNVLNVHLRGVRFEERLWLRNLIGGSSCGLCGKATIDTILQRAAAIDREVSMSVDRLIALPAQMRELQPIFGTTGGLHAVGLFNGAGEALTVCEDIGRHNAVDKAIGLGLKVGWLADAALLLASGRASFEIVQKALMARVPMVASVSAASSLAVELAEGSNMTLIGFLREDRMTVYAGADRVAE